jgi:hypothetical protein
LTGEEYEEGLRLFLLFHRRYTSGPDQTGTVPAITRRSNQHARLRLADLERQCYDPPLGWKHPLATPRAPKNRDQESRTAVHPFQSPCPLETIEHKRRLNCDQKGSSFRLSADLADPTSVEQVAEMMQRIVRDSRPRQQLRAKESTQAARFP